MSGMNNRRIKIRGLSTALVFILFLSILPFVGIPQARAAELNNRSIFIQSSFASEVTNHDYLFQTAGPSTVGSVGFLYCSNSPLHEDPCTAPAGLDVSGASIDSQSGFTGFGVSVATTANDLILTRAPALEPATPVGFSLGNIQNPSGPNQTYYVRISVFDNVDGGGTRVDRGSVAFVVEDRYDVTAYVPPYMTFCVAVTVALDCSTIAGFLADFGEFSEISPTTATTQFSVATNDPSGYNTFITGQTMTSGVNIIPALSTTSASSSGTSQFGLNLRNNSVPNVGADPQAGAVASGVPDPDYNTPNLFRFVDGDRLAYSPNSTGFNRYTVSYIVNINPAQAPGIYATTLSFTSVASF